MSEQIQRVLVWPPILRVLHLMMASTVMILLVTGLLLQSGMILNEQLYLHLLEIWHLPAGNVLVFVLVIRVALLLVKKDVSGWRALIPDSLEGIINTATFYLSLGRMNLPGYFAHNPLWKIVYLVWLVMLSLQAFSGVLLESAWLRSVFHTDTSTTLKYHQLLLEPLTVVLIAHILTALLHDWKTPTGELSAINNGYKHFPIGNRNTGNTVEAPVTVNIDNLLKTKKHPD